MENPLYTDNQDRDSGHHSEFTEYSETNFDNSDVYDKKPAAAVNPDDEANYFDADTAHGATATYATATGDEGASYLDTNVMGGEVTYATATGDEGASYLDTNVMGGDAREPAELVYDEADQMQSKEGLFA